MLSFKQLRQLMKVQGSGTVAVREHAVSSFTRLHLSVHGAVELVQSTQEKVVVEADDNLLDFVGVVNSGRTLFITNESGLRAPDFSTLRVTVHLRQLDKLDLAGHGPVRCQNQLTALGPLEIKVNGAGNTDLWVASPALTLQLACDGDVILRGACDQATLKTTASGHLHAAELRAQHLKLRNLSAGNVAVWAEQTIAIQHLGAGFVHYGGPACLTDIRHFGAGLVQHVE
jgi:hypothetical protein